MRHERLGGYSTSIVGWRRDSSHFNFLLANQHTAAALKAKSYHYRFVYATQAGHCQGNVQSATLANTLLWAWRGYPVP